VDKRVEVGKEKYTQHHREIVTISYDLLKHKSFINISFHEISKFTSISKTTIYDHFYSDINLLFLETLLLYQKNLISTFKNLSDPKKNIINIYESIFNFANVDPLLFKNMHMISINLNTLNQKKYKYKSKIYKIIKNNYQELTIENYFLTHWSLATLLCLQIQNSDFDFSIQKKLFFKDLKKLF